MSPLLALDLAKYREELSLWREWQNIVLGKPLTVAGEPAARKQLLVVPVQACVRLSHLLRNDDVTSLSAGVLAGAPPNSPNGM